MGGSDSEEEAEEQMRISFLGDVKQGGRTSKGVLAGVADEVRPDASLTHPLGYSLRLWPRRPKRMISLSCSIKAKP